LGPPLQTDGTKRGRVLKYASITFSPNKTVMGRLHKKKERGHIPLPTGSLEGGDFRKNTKGQDKNRSGQSQS